MAFTEINKDGVVYTAAENIFVKHGFTTRFGGVSTGIYDSLNLCFSCGDETEKVIENYGIFAKAAELGEDGFVFSRQVHRDDIRVCTEEDRQTLPPNTPYEADGLITKVEGLPLLIFTADCTPVLLYDPVCRAVGAVHAGWRGTVLDIVGKAVRKMQTEFGCKAGDIRAAIGPCISQCCFETGEEVYTALFDLLGEKTDEFAVKKPMGKYMIDLKGVNAYLLKAAGVGSVEISPECTKCKHEKYWSHRATNGKRGTQCSFIML